MQSERHIFSRIICMKNVILARIFSSPGGCSPLVPPPSPPAPTPMIITEFFIILFETKPDFSFPQLIIITFFVLIM